MANVLIVEDTNTEAEIMMSALRGAGFNTMRVASGPEARMHLNQQKPDLIVLDVVLPGESGFELCRDLKDQPATKNIPIVICSTKSGEMDKFWGMKQGAATYLAKPIVPDELVRAVKLLIG